jgi:hypothetical protein
MTTLTIVVPQGIDAPEGYALPSAPAELGVDLYKWEQAASVAVLTASYVLSVTALSTYKARSAGTDQATVIKGFDLRGPKGKAMSKQDVSRLDILGLAVSHGVTDVQSVRSAINYALNKRGKGMDVVRAIIRNWAVDEKRSDSGLVKVLRAGEDKTIQEVFEAALKAAANSTGRAADCEGVTMTDDCLAFLEAITASVSTLTA